MKPVFLRQSVWTASSLPEFMSERSDVVMSECGDAVSNRSRLSMLVIVKRVLEGLT